jgi:hypothetical protein
MEPASSYPDAYRQLQDDLNACLAIVKGLPNYRNAGFHSADLLAGQLQDAISSPTIGVAANLEQHIKSSVTPVVDVVNDAFKQFPAADQSA